MPKVSASHVSAYYVDSRRKRTTLSKRGQTTLKTESRCSFALYSERRTTYMPNPVALSTCHSPLVLGTLNLGSFATDRCEEVPKFSVCNLIVSILSIIPSCIEGRFAKRYCVVPGWNLLSGSNK